jgi:hypothetical protein
MWVKACNETFAGETEQYINAQMLEKLAEQLSAFPKSNLDEVTFEVGDIDSTDGHCELKFHCFDSAGHTAVLVSVSNDSACIAKFTVQFEALSLDAFISSIKFALKSGSGVSELIGVKPYTQNV